MVSLPFCHSRRELPAEPGAIYCVHPRVHIDGMKVNVAICRMCDYWKQPAPEQFQEFPPPPPRGPCAFLGEVIEMRECENCGGKTHYKVFACSHPAHTETTWEECKRCPDHREKTAPADATAPAGIGS